MKKIRKVLAYLLSLAMLGGCFNGMSSVMAKEDLPVRVTWDVNGEGHKTGTITLTLTQSLFDEFYLIRHL